MTAPLLSVSVTIPSLIFVAALVTVHGHGGNPTESCSNLKCRITEEAIVLSWNRSVDPCTDFYEHACGGWKAMNPVELSFPLHSVKSHFVDLTLKTHAQISEMFKTVQPSDLEALQKSKEFYDACMDLDGIELKGLTPLEMILTQNGVWPLIVPSDKWNPLNLTWQRIHENFVKHAGVSALFDISVDVDRRNFGAHILTLSVPTVPSGKKHPLRVRTKRDTKKTGYRRYVADVARAITESRGSDVAEDDFLTEIAKMFPLEDKLDKLASGPEEDDNDDGTDLQVMTIETLQKDWDNAVQNSSNYSIDWLNTINGRFIGTGIVIDVSDKIALKPGCLIADLADVLIGTPVRTIVNYLHWKVIDSLLPLTNSGFSNPTVLSPFASDRSGKCINNHKMSHTVSYMYAKKYFNEKSRTAALEIVEHIRDEIKREISNSSWFDDETKSAAQSKIDGMTNFIGYPEWYDEPSKIDVYYSELTVGPDYFDNVIAYKKFKIRKQLLRLRSPVSASEIEWPIQPHIVNAGYDKQTNSLSFPAAILQPPFFFHERSSVLNYGAFGAIVGHEISHGFDNIGRLYDKNGNKKKWWTQSTIDTYKIKANCFIEQYNNYTVYEDHANNETIHVSGTKSQGENIADTTGFRAGLRAYQMVKNDEKTNNVTVQLLKNFSDEQLYFYGLANAFCETVLDQGLRIYASQPHCPARWRIIGALSNIREFADAFECPLGSPMNPSKKCLLWD